MNLFYHSEAVLGSTVLIEQQEALHITKVFRKKDGDSIELTDGKGNLYSATLSVQKKETFAKVNELLRTDENLHPLEIAICPTKNNERLEWFVEKAVEIGIGKIILIEAEHSERVHIKLDRLHKIAISAMKQSLKLHLPVISEIQKFDEAIKSTGGEIKCLAHCYEGNKTLLKNALIKGKAASVFIGPEGDFSKREVEVAEQNGFISVSLGKSRLRTETAALAAVNTFEIINQ